MSDADAPTIECRLAALPTDEMVSKAIRVADEAEREFLTHGDGGDWRGRLEAIAGAMVAEVGPHIAAAALRDAAAAQDAESARLAEAYQQHNAGRDLSVRPPRRPDLNTWANADEAAAHRLRRRADRIEQGTPHG